MNTENIKEIVDIMNWDNFYLHIDKASLEIIAYCKNELDMNRIEPKWDTLPKSIQDLLSDIRIEKKCR